MSNVDEAVKCFNEGNDYDSLGELDLATLSYTKSIELDPRLCKCLSQPRAFL